MPTTAAAPAELHGLFGDLPDAVFMSDSAGRVEYLNPAAAELARTSTGSPLGQPLDQVLLIGSEDAAAPFENPADTCLRTQEPVGPVIARTRGPGPARVLELSASPVRQEDGAISGVILLARDVTRARALTQRLSHQATHDALTGLVNRTEFERRLGRALLNVTEHGGQHVLGFLDLDGFKRVNDTCGHLAGDQLLRELSRLIRGLTRSRDTIARLGGDEFGILLEHCSPAQAVYIAQEIRVAISQHRFTCNGSMHHVGASIGIVPLEQDARSPLQWLRAADTACYEAKRAGGNRIQLGGLIAAGSAPLSNTGFTSGE